MGLIELDEHDEKSNESQKWRSFCFDYLIADLICWHQTTANRWLTIYELCTGIGFLGIS